MTENIAWWLWLAAGLVLMVAELAVPAFFLLWFGVAAALVAGVTWLAGEHLNSTQQILLWIILALALVAFWFKGVKGRKLGNALADRNDASPWSQLVGEAGTITRRVSQGEPGKIRFQRPIGDAEEWACSTAESAIAVGARAWVIGHDQDVVRVASHPPGAEPSH